MLSLKPSQMNTLDAQAEARFVERLMGFVRQECNSKDALRQDLVPADDAALRQLVRQRLGAARAYGLRDEQSLASFMALSFTLALNFDEAPHFKSVLGDASLPPERRMEKAFQLVIKAEAQRNGIA